MAGALAVRENSSLISRLDRVLYSFELWLALIGGLTVFGLMLLAVVSVGGRTFFNAPLPGYVDWIEQAMPIIALLGVSYCQRLGGHIRMDIFVAQLGGRALWLMEAFGVLLMFLLVVLLVWGSWSHFERSFDFAALMWSRDSSLDIRLPLWPAKLLVPFAFSVLAIRLALQFVVYTFAFVAGEDYPPAVPLFEDAATIAANEAASVSGFDNDLDSSSSSHRERPL